MPSIKKSFERLRAYVPTERREHVHLSIWMDHGFWRASFSAASGGLSAQGHSPEEAAEQAVSSWIEIHDKNKPR